MADLYIVEFKGSRKGYFYNTYYHTLRLTEQVIVQAEQGEEIGLLARHLEASRVQFNDSNRPHSILRPANKEDKTRYDQQRLNEAQYKKDVLTMVRRHGLIMKIVDVEIQFDGSKITFYFTADHRVDFRALVRELAGKYRTRIELRQIGVRDEARRIDGYGICGRRQCCNSFIKEFAPISTAHAREQDLSLNPSKISGNCGRLLCCLRYEVEQYTGVRKLFPSVGSLVETKNGNGVIERIDYFHEQAVIMAEDNTSFRANVEDITSVKSGGRSRIRPADRAASVPDDEEPVEVDEETLKRLDEPDALN